MDYTPADSVLPPDHPHRVDPHIPPDAPTSWPQELSIIAFVTCLIAFCFLVAAMLTAPWLQTQTLVMSEALLAALPGELLASDQAILVDRGLTTINSPYKLKIGPYRTRYDGLDSWIPVDRVNVDSWHALRAFVAIAACFLAITATICLVASVSGGALTEDLVAICVICGSIALITMITLQILSGVLLWMLHKQLSDVGYVYGDLEFGFSYWFTWVAFVFTLLTMVCVVLWAKKYCTAARYAQQQLVRRSEWEAMQSLDPEVQKTKGSTSVWYQGEGGSPFRYAPPVRHTDTVIRSFVPNARTLPLPLGDSPRSQQPSAFTSFPQSFPSIVKTHRSSSRSPRHTSPVRLYESGQYSPIRTVAVSDVSVGRYSPNRLLSTTNAVFDDNVCVRPH